MSSPVAIKTSGSFEFNPNMGDTSSSIASAEEEDRAPNKDVGAGCTGRSIIGRWREKKEWRATVSLLGDRSCSRSSAVRGKDMGGRTGDTTDDEGDVRGGDDADASGSGSGAGGVLVSVGAESELVSTSGGRWGSFVTAVALVVELPG